MKNKYDIGKGRRSSKPFAPVIQTFHFVGSWDDVDVGLLLLEETDDDRQINSRSSFCCNCKVYFVETGRRVKVQAGVETATAN